MSEPSRTASRSRASTAGRPSPPSPLRSRRVREPATPDMSYPPSSAAWSCAVRPSGRVSAGATASLNARAASACPPSRQRRLRPRRRAPPRAASPHAAITQQRARVGSDAADTARRTGHRAVPTVRPAVPWRPSRPSTSKSVTPGAGVGDGDGEVRTRRRTSCLPSSAELPGVLVPVEVRAVGDRRAGQRLGAEQLPA